MDIVIYTNLKTLLHKKTPDRYCYWSLKRSPINFVKGDRVYFAVKGKVVGSFLCENFSPGSEETILWNTNSWLDADDKFYCKPFQGFKYKWWK